MALNNFTIPCLFFLALNLIAQCGESRMTKDVLAKSLGAKSYSNADEGTNWAVLVAGSKGYGNYRHQADICHAYQILKSGGLKDENIVVFMYDDIAYNEENPTKGTIINNPQGGDVYKGVPKDYTGKDVTTSNLLAAIRGDETSIIGGSGKVVGSGPNDRIFIYYSDHGSPGVLTMPNDDLYADKFIDTLKTKYESGSYKSMVIYVEACEAGSIFEGLLPKEWNVYVTTASNPSESSWATYCPGEDPSPPIDYGTCLGDLYSVSWMEDSDSHNLESESLQQQYEVVKKRTVGDSYVNGSHVMQYGDLILDQDMLSYYLGANNPTYPQITPSYNSATVTPISSVVVEQHEADILYLRRKVVKAPEGSMKKADAQKELDEALAQRRQVDYKIEAIGKSLLGDDKNLEMLKTVRPAGKPIVDDWDCFKSMVNTYKAYCGPLSTYGKKHLRVFANVCNAGVKLAQMVEATLHVCGNN